MNAWPIATSLFFGFLIGVGFFGMLWLTVRRLPTSKSPALLMLASLAVRAGWLAAGFIYLIDRRWEQLVAALVGVVLARLLLVYWMGDSAETMSLTESIEKGVHHGS